ncbi:MFS transporter [Streptomyces sp. OfavH-34-F]|uniref:MFS transporter n=1 Tax=Streptomyces sp. OfavH-34-F TaxID=2917760 RepID=UPI001EF3C33C|nr:MFS transporter [Streptomyces sp. OfavH-34-F]MCG7528626.1 MFS transporter [Streptomyces sp. OfavH-34-F]
MAGYAVSSYGTFLNMVALNLFVYETTGRALAMGLFMAVRLGAGFVAGLVAGALLARRSAKSVLLWTNVAQGAVLVPLIAAPESWRTPSLFAVSVVAGSCGTLFMVALRSSVPEMVGEERRGWANSLSVTGRSLAMVAGFASAGVVVSLVGYTAAFAVDLGTFAVCALTVALLPVAGGGKGGRDGAVRERPRRARPRKPVAFAALAAVPGLGLMVALRGVDALGSSSHNAALPVHSAALDAARPALFVSAFWCLWAVGNIAAQQVIQRYGRRTGRSAGAAAFGYGTCVMSTAFVLAFAGFPAAATAVVALIAGAADGLTEVAYTSHLQTLPAGPRAHAFGLSATVENLGFGVGMIAVAAALEHTSPLAVVGWSHGAALVLAAVFLVRTAMTRARRTAPSAP